MALGAVVNTKRGDARRRLTQALFTHVRLCQPQGVSLHRMEDMELPPKLMLLLVAAILALQWLVLTLIAWAQSLLT